jgi:hypothetical protein
MDAVDSIVTGAVWQDLQSNGACSMWENETLRWRGAVSSTVTVITVVMGAPSSLSS